MQSKAQIDQALRQMSDAKDIPGVVAIAATGKDIIYQGAFGKRDLGTGVARQREFFRLGQRADADDGAGDGVCGRNRNA